MLPKGDRVEMALVGVALDAIVAGQGGARHLVKGGLAGAP